MGNQNSQEIGICVVVWLTKIWEVELPRKFYFLQNGGNNLPRPPQVSGNSMGNRISHVQPNKKMYYLGNEISWALQIQGKLYFPTSTKRPLHLSYSLSNKLIIKQSHAILPSYLCVFYQFMITIKHLQQPISAITFQRLS